MPLFSFSYAPEMALGEFQIRVGKGLEVRHRPNCKKGIDIIRTCLVANIALVEFGRENFNQLDRNCRSPTGAPTPAGRSRLWERWRHGQSRLGPQLARRNPAALSRLAAVREHTEKVDIAVSMPLWRALDPAPIDWLELQHDPLDSVRRTHDLMEAGGFSPVALPDYEARYLQEAGCSERALAALERHWIAIRALHASNALGAVAHLYLTWLASLPFLQAHPTLGAVAGKLMAHCHEHFSVVATWPDTEQQVEQELAAFNLCARRGPVGWRISAGLAGIH